MSDLNNIDFGKILSGALGEYTKGNENLSGALSQFQDQIKGTQGNQANLPALAFAAGLLKPTRTGSFGESVGNAGEGAIGTLQQQRQIDFERQAKILELQSAKQQLLGNQLSTLQPYWKMQQAGNAFGSLFPGGGGGVASPGGVSGPGGGAPAGGDPAMGGGDPRAKYAGALRYAIQSGDQQAMTAIKEMMDNDPQLQAGVKGATAAAEARAKMPYDTAAVDMQPDPNNPGSFLLINKLTGKVQHVGANPVQLPPMANPGMPTTGMPAGGGETKIPDVRDLQARPGSPDTDPSSWDKRTDGSQKGNGWLGLLRRPDGAVSSELSVDGNIDGKPTSYPLMVPSLTRQEVDHLMSVPADQVFKLPDFQSIAGKARIFAQQRIAAGKSPFAGPTEGPSAAPAPETPQISPANDFTPPLRPEIQQRIEMLPQNNQGMVAAILEGRMAPPTGRILADPVMGPLFRQALQVDPQFDETTWAARNKMVTGMADTSNKAIGYKIDTAKKLIDHLTSLVDAAADRDQTHSVAANYIPNAVTNKLGTGTGKAALNRFNQAKTGVSAEYGNLMTAGGGTSGEREDQAKNLGEDEPLTGTAGTAGEIVHQLAGQIEPLVDQYNGIMKTNVDTDQVLGKKTAQRLAALRTIAETAKTRPVTAAEVKETLAGGGLLAPKVTTSDLQSRIDEARKRGLIK